MNSKAVPPVRVLLIEDELWAAAITTEMLKRMPQITFDIGHALTLAAGLPLITDGVDVVVADLNLPNGKGLKTVQAIYERTSGKIPLVVVTAEQSGETGFGAAKIGADAYLLKPLDYDKFCSVLSNAIAKKRLDIDLCNHKTRVGAVKEVLAFEKEGHTA